MGRPPEQDPDYQWHADHIPSIVERVEDVLIDLSVIAELVTAHKTLQCDFEQLTAAVATKDAVIDALTVDNRKLKDDLAYARTNLTSWRQRYIDATRPRLSFREWFKL